MKTYLAAWAIVAALAVLMVCQPAASQPLPISGLEQAQFSQPQGYASPKPHNAGPGRRDCAVAKDWYGHYVYPCQASLRERVAFCDRFELNHQIWRVSDSHSCPRGYDGGTCRNINRQVLGQAWSLKDGTLKYIKQAHNRLENGFKENHLAKQVYEFNEADRLWPSVSQQLSSLFGQVNQPDIQATLMPEVRIALNCILDETDVRRGNNQDARKLIPAQALANREPYIRQYQEWMNRYQQQQQYRYNRYYNSYDD